MVTSVFGKKTFRRSHVATSRSRSTKTEAGTVRGGICEIAEVSVSAWDRTVWREQDPTPNTALRTAAWSWPPSKTFFLLLFCLNLLEKRLEFSLTSLLHFFKVLKSLFLSAGSMRSSLSVSSSGSRAPALPRNTVRSSWSGYAGNSRTPGSASPRWSDASTNWRASSPKRSSRRFSRTRRWAHVSGIDCLFEPGDEEQKEHLDLVWFLFAGKWRRQRGHRSADLLRVLQSPDQSKSGTQTYGEMLCKGDHFFHFSWYCCKLILFLNTYFSDYLTVWEPDFLRVNVPYKDRRVSEVHCCL